MNKTLKVKVKGTYHGLLQLCVRARDLTPSWWYILSTEREVPMEWPDSTVITPAIFPDWWTVTRSGNFGEYRVFHNFSFSPLAVVTSCKCWL